MQNKLSTVPRLGQGDSGSSSILRSCQGSSVLEGWLAGTHRNTSTWESQTECLLALTEVNGCQDGVSRPRPGDVSWKETPVARRMAEWWPGNCNGVPAGPDEAGEALRAGKKEGVGGPVKETDCLRGSHWRTGGDWIIRILSRPLG